MRGDKKQLTGQNRYRHLRSAIKCGRLIANVIIYYNSAILSRLLEKYQTSKNAKALALLKKISPAACSISTFMATIPSAVEEFRSISTRCWQTWHWKKGSLKLWIRSD